MKKIFILIFMLALTACQAKEAEEVKPLAPIRVSRYDYDAFKLAGMTYKLPVNFEELQNDGFKIKENEFYYPTIKKNQQLMVVLEKEGYEIGATLKNPSTETLATTDALVTDIYIDSKKGLNEDFELIGLGFGAPYTKASDRLASVSSDEASTATERTVNYYTNNSYISLMFTDDALTSAAIFARDFMIDQNYVGGEFIVFGQVVKFPLTLGDIEELLGEELIVDISEGNLRLRPGTSLELKTRSPISPESAGIWVDIVNRTTTEVGFKEAEISAIRVYDSYDAYMGNVYVGAPIEEIKLIDKKNQKPKRLNVDGMEEDGRLRLSFKAENSTTYMIYTDKKEVTGIEILYNH